MLTTQPWGPSTLAVHGGESGPESGPLEPPLVLSSSFGFASADEAAGAFRGANDALIYGRWGNPTVSHLEARVAALEGAEGAVATGSGMAAITGALLTVLGAGGHVVAPRAMYGEAARLLRERLPRLGITTTFIDDVSEAGYEAAIRPETALLYVETPANPTLRLTDLEAVAALGRRRGLLTLADNTFATPWCQRPLERGVDLVVHSMTKFLCGHGDAIGGVVAGSRALTERVRDTIVKGLGATLSPFNAFLIGRGLHTLALRMAQATATSARLAAVLAGHPAVERVHHSSLASHPDFELGRRQMRAPPAVLSFEVRGGAPAARRVLDRVRLVRQAVSLGDARTLLTHPASTTASTMPAGDRERAGIGEGLLRLAVGLEDAIDLEADLAQALAASADERASEVTA